MEEVEIKEKLYGLLQSICNIKKEVLNDNNDEQFLTGRLFQLTARDLIYLLYAVEDEFNISIDAEKMVHNEFNSISSIIKLIQAS